MSAVAFGDYPDVTVAFFKDTDRRKIASYTHKRIFNDGAALITEQKWSDAVFHEPVGDLRCTITSDFFGAA